MQCYSQASLLVKDILYIMQSREQEAELFKMANKRPIFLHPIQNHHVTNCPEQDSIEELSSFESLRELENILSRINEENPHNGLLFKEKYLFLMWEDFLNYPKPIGDTFQKSIAICIGSPKEPSDPGESSAMLSPHCLEGKPLPLKFDSIMLDTTFSQSLTLNPLDQVSEKYVFYPVAERVGRKILEMCTSTCIKNVLKFPLLAICHATDSNDEVYLGYTNINTVSALAIRQKGFVRKQEDIPSLSYLKSSHLEGFPSSTAVEMSVFTRYEFLEYESEEIFGLVPISGTTLSLESEWTSVSAILEPLQPVCKTIVKVQAMIGDLSTGANNLYSELSRIEFFRNCLDQHDMVNRRSTQFPDTILALKEFLTDESLSKPGKGFYVCDQIEKSLETFDDAVKNQRVDLDFTDKLWLILKDETSFDVLREALEIFYSHLGNCAYAPGICHKNVSTIARDIRKLEQRGVICPELTRSSISELLIEIGVEKLRKDYISIFVGLGILTFDSLHYSFEPDLLSQNTFKCLQKLHSILELTIVCVKRLSLPKELLSEVIRGALKEYDNEDNMNVNRVFTFSIPSLKAQQLLNPMRPVLWELSLVSRDNGYLKQSIHRYTTDCTYDHIYAPKDYHPKLMLKTACYAYWNGLLTLHEKLMMNSILLEDNTDSAETTLREDNTLLENFSELTTTDLKNLHGFK